MSLRGLPRVAAGANGLAPGNKNIVRKVLFDACEVAQSLHARFRL